MGLLPKPESCRGCPAYGNGQGFVPDEIRPQAPVVLYGQGPGGDEEAGRRYLGLVNGREQYEPAPQAPFLGKTGRMMERSYLPLAGLTREDCSLGNAIRCRWGPTNDLPPLTNLKMREAIVHCTRAHWRPPGPGLLYVAMGEYATAALTGVTRDFSGWRGYMLPLRHLGTSPVPMTEVFTPGVNEDRVFVTHHLAYLFREPTASLPAKRDWNKLALILKGDWPVRMSSIVTAPPELWPTYAAFDTEFAEDYHDRLVRYSLATRDRKVWVVEAPAAKPVPALPGTTVIMHNAPADLPHLRGLVDLANVEIEDTMYAHACLWTGKVGEEGHERGRGMRAGASDRGERPQTGRTAGGGAMSHTLNFLGSLYAWINRWKHLAHMAPRLYAGGDALGTMDVWDTGLNGGLKGELERDPETRWVYENLQRPLIGIVLKHHQRGIATDPKAVSVALSDIQRDQTQLVTKAQAYCGWPINLRSPKHLAYWLYDVEGLKAKRKYCV